MILDCGKLMKLVLASGNPHKLREMRGLLHDIGIELLGPDQIADNFPAVIEDGETFTENAIKKAVEVAAAVNYSVLADDSGFSVVALGGAPGVRSARYAGEGASDRDNMEKLLDQMRLIEDRRASFICVLAIATKHGLIRTFEGRVEGRLASKPRGQNGFGYDPIFIPHGFDQTFAELSPAIKNRISHRARAVQTMIAEIKSG